MFPYSIETDKVYIEENYEPPTIPPSGMRTVRKWGDPVMLKYGFDTSSLSTGNFQAVGLYNTDTQTYGAVTNFIKLTNSDVLKVAEIQIPDNYTVESKMNWLVYPGKGTRIHWGGDWRTSENIQWGTLALGGNLVQVESYVRLFAPDPLSDGRRYQNFAKLVGFKKSDFGRPLADLLAEGILHIAFCANKASGRENVFSESPRGRVYTPFYDPRDWRDGSVRDSALYIPIEWLES